MTYISDAEVVKLRGQLATVSMLLALAHQKGDDAKVTELAMTLDTLTTQLIKAAQVAYANAHYPGR